MSAVAGVLIGLGVLIAFFLCVWVLAQSIAAGNPKEEVENEETKKP